MIKSKNLRAGSVFITDADLKLLPGQVASVERLSPQTRMLIDKGYVAQMSASTIKVDPPPQVDTLPQEEALPPIPKEYEDLHAPEAIAYIEGVTDPQVLLAILKEEPRKTVKEAIDQQLKELEG